MRAQDSAYVLGQAALIGERRGKEQGIQGRAVEAFASVRAGGHDQERRSAGLRLQAGQRRRAALGAHPAAEDDRVVPGLAQQAGELFRMAGPVGEDQAVAVLAECGEDVRDDLPGALLISGQVPVDGRHAARAGRVGVAIVPVRSRVNVQHGSGPAGTQKRVLAGWVAGECDGVPDRSHLHGDQIVELVAAVRVAVSPSQRRAGICLTACSNAAAGT
jgi:hypothetical protein